MAINDYRDFVLVAGDVQQEAGLVKKFTVSVFDSPVGQGEKKEAVTVPDDLPKRIRRLDERQYDAEVGPQIELGEMLAGLLLPPYGRTLFAASLARLRDGEGLRLRLRLADELADLPWEYACVQDARGERTTNGFLALDPRVSIARHEAVAVPGDWFAAPGRRRVVVAMASPPPYPKLEKLPAEQQALKAELAKVAGLEAVYVPDLAGTSAEVETMPSATLKELLAALMERTDLFHFSGHGGFARDLAVAEAGGAGMIVLADENGQGVLVPADRLAELLRGRGVRLVVLGACETGRRDGHNVWSGVAAALLRAGIPAVVAMQFTIQDRLAAAFDAAFYRALVAGFTVDEAVALGRAAIRVEAAGSNVRDWGVPVLYLRAPGGRVFNPVSDESARRQAEEQSGHLFEQHVRTVAPSGRMIGPAIGTIQGEAVTVEQVVDERASGTMFGGYFFNVQGGRLVVRQKADVLDGTMLGPAIARLGGAPVSVAEEQQALARVEELLGVMRPPAPRPAISGPTCPSCGGRVETGMKFCPNCRRSLSGDGEPLAAGPKFCAQCGAELLAGAKFCTGCGARVA
jgi:hypothetical protein